MSIINNDLNNVPSTVKDDIKTFDVLSLDLVLSTASIFKKNIIIHI